MRCRVANWKTTFGLSVDEELFHRLHERGKGVCMSLLHDRRLLINSVPHGGARYGRLCAYGAKAEACHKVPGFHADAEVPLDLSFTQPGTELPIFELHEVPIQYDYAYDAWLTDPLAPDHALPWPSRRTGLKCLTAEQLKHQCYLRIKSHMLAGGHGYFDEVGVPVEIVRSMAQGYRLCLEKARLEVDGMIARGEV